MATDLLLVDSTIETPGEISPVAGTDRVSDRDPDRAGQGSAGAADPSALANVSERGATRSASDVMADYVQLTKPRIVVMILVTTVATAMIAQGGVVPPLDLFWLLLGTAGVAGSAGAANQIWERTIDLRMARTASRPLPGRRVGLVPAVLYTAVLGIGGTWLLASRFSIAPAMAGAVTWLLYVLVYTPMKTRTAWNTTVGAIAGALPVLIGYTATGGGWNDLAAWLLVGVLVAWQYPHFMAIAWMYRRQYAEAGFQMTTTVEPTGRSAAIQSILGSIAILGCGVTLCFLPEGWVGAVIAAIAVTASCLPMLKASLRFATDPCDALARKLLRSSLLVLPLILLVVTLRVFW